MRFQSLSPRLVGWRSVRIAVVRRPIAAVSAMLPAALAATGIMAGSGMPVVCCASSRSRHLLPLLMLLMAEINQFLLVLQVCGVSIALIGCRRERWLARRRR